MAVSTFGCSTDSTQPDAVLPKGNDATADKANVTGICPDGYAPVWVNNSHLNLFKRDSDCKKGLGFCFGYTIQWNLECHKIVVVDPGPDPTAKYFPTTDRMDFVVQYLDDYNARVWIDAAAAASPSVTPTFFNNLDISNTTLQTGATLQGGIYPKHVYGTYYYYDVPFL